MNPDPYRTAALSGASAVLLGAFGAHALKGRDPAMLDIWKTAASYHLVHSAALLVASSHPSPWPATLFSGGLVLFSGSLYALVLTDAKWLGAVTPLGGLLLTGGWLALLLPR